MRLTTKHQRNTLYLQVTNTLPGLSLAVAPEVVLRLIADIDARDAVLHRLIEWNTTKGYTTLADIAAEARKVVG